MKALITGLMLFLTISVMSQSVIPLGWCSGRAYFKVVGVPETYQVQVRVANVDPPFLDYISTGSDEIFDIAQPDRNVQVSVQMRYRAPDNSNWPFPWILATSIPDSYQGCNTLPVRLGKPKAEWKDDYTIQITVDVEGSDSEPTVIAINLRNKKGTVVYAPFYYEFKAGTIPGKYILLAKYTLNKTWYVLPDVKRL